MTEQPTVKMDRGWKIQPAPTTKAPVGPMKRPRATARRLCMSMPITTVCSCIAVAGELAFSL